MRFLNSFRFRIFLLQMVLAVFIVASCDSNEPDASSLPDSSQMTTTAGGETDPNRKAITAWHKGDFQTALQHLKKAADNARRKGDQKEMARVLNTQGLVNWSLQNMDAALECYEQAGEIAEQNGMSKLLGLTHTNRGLIYKARGIYDKALSHNDKAIAIFSQNKNYREWAIALNNQGQIYKNQKQTEIAKRYYLQAIATYKKENYLDGMGASYYNLAGIYKVENAKSEALKNIKESILLSTAAKNRVQITDAYKMLAEIYEHFNIQDSALKYYKVYTERNTAQMLANQSDKIAEYQAELGAELKNLRIANLQKEQQLSQTRLWLVVIFSILILLSVLIVFYRYLLRMRFRKQSLELELENSRHIIGIKERELKDYILDLSEKNRTINKLQEQLHKYTSAPDSNPDFQQLLDQKILTDDDWVIFKEKFKNIYPMFFTRVRQSKVSLSEAETRLIMLLCLNLTGKEMAATLGISDQSARVGKLRLKKKLISEGFAEIGDFVPLLVT